MTSWRPPDGSVVRASGHRVDPADFAGRYSGLMVCLGAMALGLALYWSGERLFEDAAGRRLREANAAPWEVACFFALLMGAGATKRLFGFESQAVVPLLVALVVNAGGTIVLTGLSSEPLTLGGLGAIALIVVLLSDRWSVGPWAAFAFVALALAATSGVGFSSRLPPGSDGDWALVSLVMAAGAIVGLGPRMWRLCRGAA